MSRPLPKISIVTPSFKHGAFLEEAIQSVLNQNYPHLEYIVMDGGSNDGSVDIIRKYEDRLAHWVSAPDQGQYDAINRGFARTTGEIMAWLNSDDKYCPWAFSIVGEIFADFPEIEWLTTLYPVIWDEKGRAVELEANSGFSREGFLRGENLPGCGWYARNFIQQESTFWRRSLWERAGGRLDTSYSLAGDFELWARFNKTAELYAVGTPLGGYRRHGVQITSTRMTQYLEQAAKAFFRHGGRTPSRLQTFLLSKTAKVLRFLQRKYDHRMAAYPANKHCLYRGREGGWRIKEI